MRVVPQTYVYFALLVFLLLLVFRLIMEYVFMLARSYRPTGLVAAALELAYSVTDPPLNALRRVIPPLRIRPGEPGPGLHHPAVRGVRADAGRAISRCLSGYRLPRP